MECPACGKAVKTEHGLVKHLAGGFSYGGHELPKTKAESVAASVGAGTPFEPSLGKHDAVEKAVPATYLQEVFTRIVEFKKLPKYQFERRVDALLLPFLPDLLGQVMSGEVQHVVPEFPLKKPGTFQSTNVDHLFYLRGASPPLDVGCSSSSRRIWVLWIRRRSKRIFTTPASAWNAYWVISKASLARPRAVHGTRSCSRTSGAMTTELLSLSYTCPLRQ